MARRIDLTDKYVNNLIKKLGFGKALIQLDLDIRSGFVRYKPRSRDNYYIDSKDWDEAVNGTYKEIPRYFKGS